MSIEQKLRALATRWATAAAAERANAQIYLSELCEALEVEKPRPAGSGYEFEYPVRVVNRDGTETTNFVDCFKRGHFVLEAKDQGTAADDTILLRKAYGQARAYTAAADGGPPPYALVLDVGRTLLVWDPWSGTYGGFSAATRIHLATLADNPDSIALLRDIFDRPQARNPNVRSVAVTKEIAEQLAELAAALEARGFEHERIARFLIRCVFTMFAEDTGLIPDAPFTQAMDEIGFADPDEFAVALAGLWKAMDEGTRFGLKKFMRFNGHFFEDQEVLPLTVEDLAILRRAAAASWEDVEPSIMGTLLVRALDPVERHRLGAEYTPREFVERIVRPTVEEPIRERWTAVQGEVLQLRDTAGLADRTRRDKDKQAVERLRGFHEWIRGLRFLDPACGSGNFLYVTLAIVKQVELEVLRAIEEVTGAPELAVEEVGPWQFYGIEVKLWAREIAELSLWIGYHQWWRRTHGHTQPPEPVLRDTGTLENRDAILEWDVLESIEDNSRPDPTPIVTHPVTGELVPDPSRRITYMRHTGARAATWPRADFIIGNPPYMGGTRMRDAFGEGYTEALRDAYPDLAPGVDYVMYWWYRAAAEVAAGRTIRAGLITTNSIRQQRNRRVVDRQLANGIQIIAAVPDHPWPGEDDGAAVRVSMTVIGRGPALTRLMIYRNGEIASTEVAELGSDLSATVSITDMVTRPLLSNQGIASNGFYLRGAGFVLSSDEAIELLQKNPAYGEVIRPYVTGGDVVAGVCNRFVIDFARRDEEEARRYPHLFSLVRDRVFPERQAKKEKSARELWWQFWRTRDDLRAAIWSGMRFIVTPYVTKHRFFTYVDAEVAPDDTVVAIGLDDDVSLGILSSSIHVTYATAAGGRLGVGNDPRYNASLCFAPFPFPRITEFIGDQVATAMRAIERHRRMALEQCPKLTMTAMYNVVSKLRKGDVLTPKERKIHECAACSLLVDAHDNLDGIVAAAYGWSWPLTESEILQGLIELHRRRLMEEKLGEVQWLRPSIQANRYADTVSDRSPGLGLISPESDVVAVVATPWPSTVVDQFTAIQALLASQPASVDTVLQRFSGARRDIVARHLETLVLMGEVRALGGGVYEAVRQVA